jgi:hypothetical protein
MSTEETKEPTLADLEARIKRLEEYQTTQAVPAFDDVYRMLAAVLQRVQAFQNETYKHVSELNAEHTQYMRETRDKLVDLSRALEVKIEQELAEVRRGFNERVTQEIARVSAEDIAQALTRRVLTVRTAQRGEQVDIAVRQATPQEIRGTKLF